MQRLRGGGTNNRHVKAGLLENLLKISQFMTAKTAESEVELLSLEMFSFLIKMQRRIVGPTSHTLSR